MLGTHCAFHNIFRLIIRQPMTTVLPFLIKGPPRSPLLLMICRLLAFLFSVDKSIGSGCFFPGLDPSVNLIGHATITEMIKLQFTTITDRIRNKIRNGNWFPKFSINRKEQKFLLICLRLLTLLTIIKDPSSYESKR